MFETFYGFFAVYAPLVIFAIIDVVKEEKLIAFEQRLKAKIRAIFALKGKTKAK